MPEKPKPHQNSSFASRRAAREANGASDTPPERQRTTIRAGLDAPQPTIVVVNR